MKTIVANILDWPQKGLNPQICTENNILRPNVKQFILDFISSFAQANNFKDTFAWIKQVKFVGSLTTNLWNSHSDLDIHCEVDLPKFVEVEHPEMTEKEASDYLDGIRKQVDQVKAKVPGTEHPLEIFFENEFTTRASQQFSGTYSVLEDKWITEPHIVGQDFDIATLHPDLLNLAKETAAELDESFGEIKQDVQDIKELAETIDSWPVEQRSLLEKKLQKRLEDLEKEIKDLVVIREDVAEKRKHYKALSEQEVRFKYLQKYFYMHVLTDLKTLLKQSPELSTKDIPVVENIMSQASKHEDSAEGRICIDFDQTIAEDNENGTIGAPEPNAKAALEKLKADGWYIIIFSHRSTTEYGEDQIKEFLDKYEIPYDEIYTEKPNAEFFIDDRAITFSTWSEVLKKVETKHLPEKEAALILPIIDPKTLNRKEPYALYIGTQMYSKNMGVDMFDIFGEHPMITESNAVPTVTLDTLIKENIPVIGKEPRAGDKQPFQDLSRVVKQAQLGSEYDFSSTHFLLPKELAEKIVRWAVENIPEDQIVHDEKDPGTKGIQLESHITLKYGLKTDNFEEVKKALEIEKAPHVKFNKTSFFEPEGKDYDVVIIPVESEDLQKLNEKLCSQVEHEDLQFKEYHPHVTVAYVKKGLGKTYDGKDIITDEEIYLDVLTFSPKKGEKRELELHKKASTENLVHIGNITLKGKKSHVLKVEVPQDLLEKYFAHATITYEMLKNQGKTSIKDLNAFDRERTKLHNQLVEFAFSRLFQGKNYEDFPAIAGDIRYKISDFVESMVPREDLPKESSFMPSNTDLAPSDDWAGTVGYPTNESMDAPQNKSDESTWYSPENDRPRTKNFWEKMLSLFKRPLSKKEPIKDIVPVKEAEVKKKAVNRAAASWIDPSGKPYYLDDSKSATHMDWIFEHEDLLQKEYGYEPIDSGEMEESHNDIDYVDSYLVSKDWSRIGDIHHSEFGIEVSDLSDIPQGLLMYLISMPWDDNLNFYIEDSGGAWVNLPLGEIRTDGQKAVNKARQQKRMQLAKQAGSVITLHDELNKPVKVYKNPPANVVDKLLYPESGENTLVRGVIDYRTGDVFVWDAYDLPHEAAMEQLGIPVNDKTYPDDTFMLDEVEGYNWIVNNTQKNKLYKKQAKQWVTPKEPVNQPGMDWQWADYMYDYIGDIWRDLLHDWLGLDPDNYVKPIILIQEIYEDEGVVSAWVHIEFINEAGTSDAFMKFILSAKIEYEESIEPEGSETYEHLAEWEMEVVDYGKSDELEKTSKLTISSSVIKMPYENGPTILIYQNPTPEQAVNAFNKSKEPSLRTYTDPNTGDLYIWDAWFAEHMEVLNFLGLEFHDEGINQVFSPGDARHMAEDATLDKESSYGPTNYQGPSVADHGYQNSAWDDMNVTYSPEEDEELMDQNGKGGYPNRWMSRHRGPYYTNEGKVVRMLEDTKPQKQASISGQTVNTILKLIEQTGGATYNLSKGNLVGTDAYAVAIYPDREQIVPQVDFDTVEGYLTQNEDLLNNSNNSFGAWVSGGKTYLDVVATVKDKNQAMQLGLKHKQLAIFDLKNLVEIPLQRTAKLAGVYTDKEMAPIYDKIYSDRWRDDSSRIDGGFEYNKGWSELNGNDFPAPKDLDKERALLDQLQKPIDRNMPTGLGEYAITYYDAFSDQGDQGGI